MKNIKQAFEEYYAGIKAPEDTDLKVLLRIEREGKRKMFRFIVFESVIILLLSSFLLYHHNKTSGIQHPFYGWASYKARKER